MKKIISFLLCLTILFGMFTLAGCETPSERKKRKEREEIERNADKYTVELRVDLSSGYDWERITSGKGRVKISDKLSTTDPTKSTGKRVFTITARKAGTATVVFTRRLYDLMTPDEFAQFEFVIDEKLKIKKVTSSGNYFERIQNETLNEAQS